MVYFYQVPSVGGAHLDVSSHNSYHGKFIRSWKDFVWSVSWHKFRECTFGFCPQCCGQTADHYSQALSDLCFFTQTICDIIIFLHRTCTHVYEQNQMIMMCIPSCWCDVQQYMYIFRGTREIKRKSFVFQATKPKSTCVWKRTSAATRMPTQSSNTVSDVAYRFCFLINRVHG